MAFRKLRQEDYLLKASLGYVERPYLKKSTGKVVESKEGSIKDWLLLWSRKQTRGLREVATLDEGLPKNKFVL